MTDYFGSLDYLASTWIPSAHGPPSHGIVVLRASERRIRLIRYSRSGSGQGTLDQRRRTGRGYVLGAERVRVMTALKRKESSGLTWKRDL
jgi:hypothetical protein